MTQTGVLKAEIKELKFELLICTKENRILSRAVRELAAKVLNLENTIEQKVKNGFRRQFG